MNVGVFNKVNFKKESTITGSMYGEWSSLPLEEGGHGVLDALGGTGGRDVVLAVVKQLANQPEPSPLATDAEVEWVLEVIRYGLSLPLSEHEALRDCVRVCCAWLAPLLPPAANTIPPPPPVPAPVAAAPARYARKILKHMHNLFVPRPSESGDLISKQAVLCHRVLRLTLQLAAGAALSAAEWRALLLLLMSAASALLSPPTPPHSSADQLCEWVLCVLFQAWILACHRCFPSPALWRTLREQCATWRHRPALTEQWARASLCLTARLLANMYGPLFPAMPISEEDASLIPADMSPEAVAQTWYRMLHTIGNPVDLCKPNLISQTPDFLQYALLQEDNRDPGQHACLLALPAIFHKAMKGLAAHVDAFLGVSQAHWWRHICEGPGAGLGAGGASDPPTPPAHRRLAKSFSVSSSTPPNSKERRVDKHQLEKTASTVTADSKGMPRASLINLTSGRPVSVAPTLSSNASLHGESERPPLAPMRPKVNSIFHLFGEWLFEAALIGTTPSSQPGSHQRNDSTPPSSLPDLHHPIRLHMLNYQPGRAEALGALCRVVCSKQSHEDVLAAYLARCYVALQRGLRDPSTAAAVVLNAQDLFRLDLDGVLVLVTDYVWALEQVLAGGGEREPRVQCDAADWPELRRAAIAGLLSLVALPYHLRALPVPQLPGSTDKKGMTFGDLAGRISLLTVYAVQEERCGSLAAPLLSALYLCVRHAPLDLSSADISGQMHSANHTNGGGGGRGAELLDEFDTADDILRDLEPSNPRFGAILVVRATYLVCHRLISSWNGDLHVSLAALELLAGLAKLHSTRADALERKRAVRWICDYISAQCGRPPQAHSRDLHSSVVAAYGCLAAWLSATLLADSECLATVMEVVELGLSGSKSAGRQGEPLKMKDEKELKPVSMRVRDAAESLLMLILEQIGVFPSACGPAAGGWSRLDERCLTRHSPQARHRHFLADDSLLLSLLEEPLANNQEPQPTVTVIVRGPFGRYAWSLQMRASARCAGWAARAGAAAGVRHIDIQEPPQQPPPTCQPLVHGPPCPVDCSFPHLDAVLRQLGDTGASQLFSLLDQQAAVEKEVRENEEQVAPEECSPPEPVTEFQTARLFLSHFGYLNVNGEKKSGQGARLVALDGAAPGFGAGLRRVDAAGARAAVTAHVFCCNAGQRDARTIVANTRHAATVAPHFLQMLTGLGWPVWVRGHAGWAGHVDTSYDALGDPLHYTPPSHDQDHGGCLYDGREQVLYWADATSEIAFVVPTELDPEITVNLDKADTKSVDSTRSDVDGNCMSSASADNRSANSCWDVSSTGSTGTAGSEGRGGRGYERTVSESSGNMSQPTSVVKGSHIADKPRTLSLELDKSSSNAAFGIAGSGRRNRQYTTKILIIWLVDYEDHLHIPIDDLLGYTETGQPWRRSEVSVICAAALANGLVRVRVAPPPPSDPPAPPAGPLVDGAVLAPHLLPDCLRQTALNIARRRRLHDDTYQPPHARRRHLIQELAQQYRRNLTEPELLQSLFINPTEE